MFVRVGYPLLNVSANLKKKGYQMTTDQHENSTVVLSSAELPPGHIIWKFPQVHIATGLSRTSIWRLVKTEGFPAPLKLVGGKIGWIASEVLDWRDNRPRVGI